MRKILLLLPLASLSIASSSQNTTIICDGPPLIPWVSRMPAGYSLPDKTHVLFPFSPLIPPEKREPARRNAIPIDGYSCDSVQMKGTCDPTLKSKPTASLAQRTDDDKVL